MTTIIDTGSLDNDLTITTAVMPRNNETNIMVAQAQGAESLVMDYETARKLAFVLIDMTDAWKARQREIEDLGEQGVTQG